MEYTVTIWARSKMEVGVIRDMQTFKQAPRRMNVQSSRTPLSILFGPQTTTKDVSVKLGPMVITNNTTASLVHPLRLNLSQTLR